MTPLKFYKREAKKSLENNWGDAAIATLVFFITTFLLTFAVQGICTLCGINHSISFTENFKSDWASTIASIIALPLVWGFYVVFLGLCRGEKITISKIFDGYRGNEFVRIFTTLFIYYIGVIIGLILFIIPGIILSLRWFMVPFVLKDYPELKNMAALKESARIMNGHKMRLFLLILSFIGWLIIGLITFGIGFIWIEPYMITTLAKFYEDITKGEA